MCYHPKSNSLWYSIEHVRKLGGDMAIPMNGLESLLFKILSEKSFGRMIGI